MSSTAPENTTAFNTAHNLMGQVKTKCQQFMTCLDKELSQVECCNEVEKRTGLPKANIVLAAAAIYIVMIFFNLGAKLLTSVIAWGYPAFASFKAIESSQKEDDTQWLTYWVVISFIQIFEYFSDVLLYWFPFYYLFKTIIVFWLTLPRFKGAEIVYVRVLRPLLIKTEASAKENIQAYVEKKD
ncbi:hypothetical protein K501DRAFT_236877 [Backusella circina FSU 941]|nr:hypothetical protein K501DRAFT_236877 [Backusella circina FSU 941]